MRRVSAVTGGNPQRRCHSVLNRFSVTGVSPPREIVSVSFDARIISAPRARQGPMAKTSPQPIPIQLWVISAGARFELRKRRIRRCTSKAASITVSGVAKIATIATAKQRISSAPTITERWLPIGSRTCSCAQQHFETVTDPIRAFVEKKQRWPLVRFRDRGGMGRKNGGTFAAGVGRMLHNPVEVCGGGR